MMFFVLLYWWAIYCWGMEWDKATFAAASTFELFLEIGAASIWWSSKNDR